MESFEAKFEKACNEGEIPGVVLLAYDKCGTFTYAKAFGEKKPGEKMDLESTFIFASCTKLMTSIAALQCVERGLISLDDDVSKVLTDLKDLEILTGADENGAPTLKPCEIKVTLRHLLTHTSGFTYDGMSPSLMKWRKSKGQALGTYKKSRSEALKLPVLFEPGSSWMYGLGLDHAGALVSKLTSTNLEVYMQNNVWDVVGANDITFHMELKPKVRENLVKLRARGGVSKPASSLPEDTGKPVVWSDAILFDDPNPIDNEMGGQGCWGKPSSYMKILKSILDNDGKLLKPETVELMFTPQLAPASNAKKALQKFNDDNIWTGTFASHEAGTPLNYGLGSGLVEVNEATGRKKGTLSWSGLTNLLWTIDRETGLALFYASNLIPFGDHASHWYQQLFEKEMYDRFAKSNSKL
ncbi:beta-lactamase/transpeptidase-like protein [Calycina marina]|uniref:Beta-lactamase/transpeptidase-like protein n=1 Tax=Calycina marina TaxID=1763456 RepID=A0A9P8CHN5_9HELO|nr:beta-lactamase/transpeptidase-like protein [Calycina marina]